jgi:hypothetical protein
MDVLEKVRIGQAAYGKGIYARRRFKKGVLVGEVTGEVIDTEGYDSNYCIDLGGPRRLEPATPFRFINHSCGPNCRFIWFEPDQYDPQPTTVWVETLRVVEPGEELTIDYCWPADAAIRCGCRSVQCRGWICDPAEFPELETRIREETGE